MQLTRAAVVAGMTVMAATGLTTTAWAAPAPVKKPVTTDQCTASGGHVQRAKDGVGTCVGNTPNDGHLIRDVSTRPTDGDATAPSSRYGSDRDGSAPDGSTRDGSDRYGTDRDGDSGSDRGYDSDRGRSSDDDRYGDDDSDRGRRPLL